jgi:hypothetical protein
VLNLLFNLTQPCASLSASSLASAWANLTNTSVDRISVAPFAPLSPSGCGVDVTFEPGTSSSDVPLSVVEGELSSLGNHLPHAISHAVGATMSGTPIIRWVVEDVVINGSPLSPGAIAGIVSIGVLILVASAAITKAQRVRMQSREIHMQLKHEVEMKDLANMYDERTDLKAAAMELLDTRLKLTEQKALRSLLRDARIQGKFGESNLTQLVFGTSTSTVLPLADFMFANARQVNLKANERDGGVGAIEAEIEANGTDDDKECLQYVLFGLTGSSKRQWPNGVLDEGRADRLTFDDFCATPEAKTAKLSRGMVLALRLYTTNVYKSLNNPMRGLDVNYQPRPLSADSPHPFPVTMHLLTEGIKQLRAVEGQSATANAKVVLWRGMRNVEVPSKFVKDGGAEKAAMSTTSDMKIAVMYSSSQCSVLLKLTTTSFRERGADLNFLSAFPGESECLFPPLTHLKPAGPVQEVTHNDGHGSRKLLGSHKGPSSGKAAASAKFLVVPVRPSFG